STGKQKRPATSHEARAFLRPHGRIWAGNPHIPKACIQCILRSKGMLFSEEQKMRRFLQIAMVASALGSVAWGATPFHVGVTNQEFLQNDPTYNWRGAKTHALTTIIWYPASFHAIETQQ